MIHAHPRSIMLAVCMAMLAGFTDALGFIKMGGVFVSFMSGNSTRLAVGLGEALMERNVVPPGLMINALLSGGIILLFVTGVVLGSFIGHFMHRWRARALLFAVACLLAAAAALHDLGGGMSVLAVMALAMGMENTVFQRDGEVSIAVTYMTGTLVRLGQRLAGALLGGPKWLWAHYLLLWAGLVTGAVGGTLSYAVFSLNGLWCACAFALALAAAAPFLAAPPRQPGSQSL